MASSSSDLYGNKISQTEHDVFLSFRGEDTRYSFTSHLHAALCRKQIDTFIDYRLKRGDEISPSLLNAIEASRVSIVVFSERYAGSRWCLEELVKIVECKSKCGQVVIPIFYCVDPSDVRNQSGAFGDSFSKLEERFKERLDKLLQWRTALRQVANLSGFDSRLIRDESALIEIIVNDVLKRLNELFPSYHDKDLVGVEIKILEIESLLSLQLKDLCSVGIWGIGGIGKTTIAGAILKKISHHFEGSCFLQNVREESEKIGGLAQLRERLVSTLLKDKNVKIGVPYINHNFEKRRISQRKVLIVLDDVTCSEQIESLIGGVDFSAKGSRIIITTRDRQVLRSCKVQKIYEMKGLTDFHSLKLFCQHAFGKNNPDVGYEELSNEIIKYTQGVPLALKVLGRFLVARSTQDWKSAIYKLQRIPHKDIQKVLKISYDGLDDEEQNIFLDIACFLKGDDKDLAIKFLDACGFSAHIGIRVLVDKALIVIWGNQITMHDLLQDMGKEIVRQESINDPGKRTRLWHHEDIYEVLSHNTGTKTIQGMSLNMSKVEEIKLNPHTFMKMHKLRFLKFYGENKCKMSHMKGSAFSKVRYLQWDGYPMKSLPLSVQPEKFVSIQMRDSTVRTLWKGVQNLVNLKQIDLRGSRQLRELPNLSLATNLETLHLSDCTSLIKIDSSFQHLNKLLILDLRNCICLKSLPASIHLKSLEKLLLSGCSNLKRFPMISSCNLKELRLNGTAIEELPSSINLLFSLFILDLRNCERLGNLPSGFCKLRSLQFLYLSGCSNLQRLPDRLGDLEALNQLHAERTSIREVPPSIVCLGNLNCLSLGTIRGQEQSCSFLPVSVSLGGLYRLTSLSICDCGITELPENLSQLPSLQHLNLERNNFVKIPESIISLAQLEWLGVSHCERLESLPELPLRLRHLDASHCTSLEELSSSFTSRLFTDSRRLIELINCFKLDRDKLSQTAIDILQKYQHTAARSQARHNISSCYFYFPGSAIPECFKFQSMGSSIALKLSPYYFNNKIFSFAFCAILSFQDYHEDLQRLYVCCECKLKTKNGNWHVIDVFLSIGGIRFVESDHVLLGNDSIGDLESYYFNEVILRFYLRDAFYSRMECCGVTKCGIHLLHNQDFWESVEATSRSFSSNKDEEPHLKRLKYSERPLQES